MHLALPLPISTYLSMHGRSTADLADLFVEGATVKDEGHTYEGIATIARWIEESSAKYDFTTQPIESRTIDGATVVTCQVTGNFPGSPVDLNYHFRLAGEKIASLEIVP